MGDDEQREPTQKTPTGHEIPVPKRADVLKNFAKVSKPAEQDNADDGRKNKAS